MPSRASQVLRFQSPARRKKGGIKCAGTRRSDWTDIELLMFLYQLRPEPTNFVFVGSVVEQKLLIHPFAAQGQYWF